MSLWNRPTNPVFKLNLQKIFRQEVPKELLSLTTHPAKNAFLVSDGISVCHLHFPEGFEKVRHYEASVNDVKQFLILLITLPTS